MRALEHLHLENNKIGHLPSGAFKGREIHPHFNAAHGKTMI